jgi:hypothetical protein
MALRHCEFSVDSRKGKMIVAAQGKRLAAPKRSEGRSAALGLRSQKSTSPRKGDTIARSQREQFKNENYN